MDPNPPSFDTHSTPASVESPLSAEAAECLKQLLLLTGRQDRYGKNPFLDKFQRRSFQAIWAQLSDPKKPKSGSDGRSDLFNRLLLTLSIMTTSTEFFQTVFEGVDFADIDAVRKRVTLFRTLCMLKYGNFRFGYKRLRREKQIKKIWEYYFPTAEQTQRHIEGFHDRPSPVGLLNIKAHELFALGNLSSESSESINAARKDLARIFQKAIKQQVNDFSELKKVAESLSLPKLTLLIARAGIPAEDLVGRIPANEESDSYVKILEKLQPSCVNLDDKALQDIKEKGLQNARIYVAMHDLNVYVATSMREPLHFTTNWAFVYQLFHTGELQEWKVRYFDPTQAYLKDRIQTGLMECLMIKRAQLTVYHAQESDTFGKDSEAGVTLAQGKPVVVFVTRLFENNPAMKDVYKIFDESPGDAPEVYAEDLDDPDLLGLAQKSKKDLFMDRARNVLKTLSADEIEMELIRQGYGPEDGDLIEFALERILRLERRALTFRDVHPLALQTSPMDGVARGVIVTRTVADTAKVVSALLGKTLNYEIRDGEENSLLVETVTNSTVRVVTGDSFLTSAFWSETWGNNDN